MTNDLIILEVHDFPAVITQDVHLFAKAQWLKSQFDCFRTDNVPMWKKRQNTHHAKPSPLPRPKIGNKEMSTEAIAKKEATSLMNKLSMTNKDHIFTQLKSSIREQHADVYTTIIWDFMLLCPDQQPLYCDILLQLSCYISVHPHVTRIWDNYISHKAWIPPQIDESNGTYDDFCDHVKWKKQAIAKVKGFVGLCRKTLLPSECCTTLLTELLATCSKSLSKNDHKETEVFIDQLFAFLHSSAHVYCDSTVLEVATKWRALAPTLSPALKFKLYDLHDLVIKKNESSK